MRLLGGLQKYFFYRKNISNEKISSIVSEDLFREMIENERYRSDRNNHTFSLVVFKLPKTTDSAAILKASLGNISQKRRRLDRFGWFDNEHIGILLPYTSRVGAMQFVERICRDFESEMQRSVDCQVFCYPENYIQKELEES